MFFLIRAAFWLSIVIILLPTGSQQPKSVPALKPAEAVSAASAAVSDMRQFCARQPEACTVGSQAAVAFGYKAQAGAKMLYDFLTDALAPDGDRLSRSGQYAQARSERELAGYSLADRSHAGLARPAAASGSARQAFRLGLIFREVPLP